MNKNLLNLLGLILGVLAFSLILGEQSLLLKLLVVTFVIALGLNFKVKKTSIHTYLSLFLFPFLIVIELIAFYRG